MGTEHPEIPESPDGRISWSVYVLTLAVSCLVCGVLVPFGILPFLAGGAWFWVALVFGGVTALVLNLARPRYEGTSGRWRKVYDFLLKQMPPPD
jgi:hypothetical protein